MKIAVPTQKSLQVAPDLGQADAFVVLTIQGGEIVHEELRKITRNINAGDGMGFLAPIHDCSAVILNKQDEEYCKLIRENRLDCYPTEEILVTNAILRYLEHEYLKESNTCCCP